MVKLTLALLALSATVSCQEYVPFDTTQLDASSYFEQFLYKDFLDSYWHESKGWIWDKNKDRYVKYKGKWAIESSLKNPAYGEQDKGLVLKSEAAHSAVSFKLTSKFNNTDQDLVLQYEIKLQSGLECGGAYIKLLDAADDYRGFNDETPYQIMFGPDKCGSENKVHFILSRPNPITGTIEKKHLRAPPMARINDLSNLYTLILKKNSDFEIRINGQVAKAGNLHSNIHLLDPPLYQNPQYIEDPNDVRPEDWDDQLMIADPNAELPEDYDIKHVLKFIPDPSIPKPDDWDENEPLTIPDPDATKPESWNEEEDGEWGPPEIPNPVCEQHGCGTWSPTLKPNPDYVGPYVPPYIPNPNYKGLFRPRQILNPDFYNDTNPSNIKLVGGIGFELWSMQNNIMFNNIYLGHSIKEAEWIGNQTFLPKVELEFEYKKNHKEKVKHEPVPPPPTFDEIITDDSIPGFKQFLVFIKFFLLKQTLDLFDFYYEFLRDPLNLITNHPIKFVLYCTVFVTFFTFISGVGAVLLFLVTGGGSASPDYPEPSKSSEEDEILDNERDLDTTQPWVEKEEPKIIELEDSEVEIVASGTYVSEAQPRKRKA
ncbi:Calnexin [Scheffersomyces amazonensis]|uniref:Calnexin n=1 Tax=Scheffersomyces amazonensis TaxID=1078765 RepID=UPI00315C99F4